MAHPLLSILAAVALGAWLLVLLDRRRWWPGEMAIDHRGRAPGARIPGEIPGVAAIVPARDEAEVLTSTLPSLLGQSWPRFRVVLVDDRSADGTAEVARRLAGEAGRSDRLEVIEAPPTPPGWTGKLHALQVGLDHLRGRGDPAWILLTDADIRHPVDSVEALLDRAAAGPSDMVSVMARLGADGFWERLLIPPFVFFFQLLYPFRRAADPRSRTAAAAGGCILVRRSVLEAAGAFASISGEIIDDCALARAAKRSGARLWLGLDPEVVSVRAYPRLADVWRMVARTAFVQLGRSYLLLALTAAVLVEVLVAPPFLLVLAAALGRPLTAAAALGAWLIPGLLLLPSVRHHRVPAAYALALPFAGLLYLLMTLSSGLDHLLGRGPLWRGRRFRPAGTIDGPAP